MREAQRLPYTELSERLTSLGRPIPVLGLRRIERGERRVDVDDLVALGRALGVPPLLLLLPVGTEPEVEVLPAQTLRTWDAALWFAGETEFPGDTETWRIANPVQWFRVHEDARKQWEVASGEAKLAWARVDQARAEDDREERLRYARFMDQVVAGAESRLGIHRRNLRAQGFVPPPLAPSLKHLDEDGGV